VFESGCILNVGRKYLWQRSAYPTGRPLADAQQRGFVGGEERPDRRHDVALASTRGAEPHEYCSMGGPVNHGRCLRQLLVRSDHESGEQRPDGAIHYPLRVLTAQFPGGVAIGHPPATIRFAAFSTFKL